MAADVPGLGSGPYLTDTANLDRMELARIMSKVFRAVAGEGGELTQAALLGLLFILWEQSEVTQEQAKVVCLDWVATHLSRRAQ